MQIGDYEVLGTIGQGGMGTVVRARRADGQEVAVKVLTSPRPDKLERFERERTLLRKLGKHSGFVPILDKGDCTLGPYLVMPFVAGGSLADRLRQGPLAADLTVDLGIALARALARAHAQGVVHRDLKPDNILFTRDGRPLIADLGLAKHVDGGSEESGGRPATVSSTGEARGTWGYMAPEQMRNSKSVGKAADVFALGVILHECLTGQLPYPGESPVEVLGRIAAGNVEPLPEAAAPAWLREVIAQVLVYDVKQRPQDAAALLRLLEQGARRARGASPRRRRWRVIGVLSALVLAGAVYTARARPEVQGALEWWRAKSEQVLRRLR